MTTAEQWRIILLQRSFSLSFSAKSHSTGTYLRKWKPQKIWALNNREPLFIENRLHFLRKMPHTNVLSSLTLFLFNCKSVSIRCNLEVTFFLPLENTSTSFWSLLQTASHFGELQSIKQPLAFGSEGFAFGHSIRHVILVRKHLPLTVEVRCSGLVEVAAWISTAATAKKFRKMATDFVLASILSSLWWRNPR